MWIEDQVRLWHRRCGDDISYLDATGTIVASHSGKRVLYDGLVVQHPNQGDPSVPVAEMVIKALPIYAHFLRDSGKTSPEYIVDN